MDRLTDTRSELAAALEAVLPGRVYGYAQQRIRWIAPSIQIEQATGSTARIGRSTEVAVVAFPVWIVMDGADRAQVAQHDQLVAEVWDACFTVGRPRRFDSATVNVGEGQEPLRASIVTVEATLDAVTLCPPTPEKVTIPTEVA